jgi:hypothetical protein
MHNHHRHSGASRSEEPGIQGQPSSPSIPGFRIALCASGMTKKKGRWGKTRDA